tara:strand:+ start:175 stop:1209 length:1035 start_codon:yes stop_codon:yes gene_type:complete
MGNSQSYDTSDDNNNFIRKQQELIESQRIEIQKLTNQQNNIVQGNVSENMSNPLSIQENKLKLILSVFELDEEYNEISLKKAYIKLAMVHHPDKGGKPANFKKLNTAYKYLLKRLSEKDNNKDHNELKKETEEYLSQQNMDQKMNVNLTEKFDNTVFNKIYDENRNESIYDDGYSDWIKDNEVNDSSQKNLFEGGYNRDQFNSKFNDVKKEKSNTHMIKYSEPVVDISFKNKDSICILGQEKIKDFSGECGNGLSFRDYKDAFTNPCLIDINSVDISKRTNNIKGMTKERKNISYTLSEEGLREKKMMEIKKEKEEQKRLKRISMDDKRNFDIYEAVHKRMLGR